MNVENMRYKRICVERYVNQIKTTPVSPLEYITKHGTHFIKSIRYRFYSIIKICIEDMFDLNKSNMLYKIYFHVLLFKQIDVNI